MTSMFCQLWAQMLSRQRAMWFWALYTGRMMLTRGFDMAASPLLFFDYYTPAPRKMQGRV